MSLIFWTLQQVFISVELRWVKMVCVWWALHNLFPQGHSYGFQVTKLQPRDPSPLWENYKLLLVTCIKAASGCHPHLWCWACYRKVWLSLNTFTGDRDVTVRGESKAGRCVECGKCGTGRTPSTPPLRFLFVFTCHIDRRGEGRGISLASYSPLVPCGCGFRNLTFYSWPSFSSPLSMHVSMRGCTTGVPHFKKTTDV